MSIKVYLLKTCDITEERFDEVAELCCRIKDSGVPICKELRDSEIQRYLSCLHHMGQRTEKG